MKNKLIIFFLVASSIGFSQKKTDSLIQALKIADNYKEKSNTLKSIYWNLVYSYPDSSIVYAKQGLSIAQGVKHDSLIGFYYNLIGIGYDVKSQGSSALTYYDSAMIHSVRAGDSSNIAGIHNNKGLIFWNQGVYEKAIEEYLLSEKIYTDINNQKGLAKCYGNIGLIYTELEDYPKSINYHKRAMNINQELENEYGLNINKLNISQLVLHNYELYSKEEIAESIEYVEDNIQYFKKEQNFYALGKVYTTKGIYYADIEKFDSALYCNELSIECYRKIGATNLLASSLYNSSFYIVANNNDRKKANKRVIEAYELIKETGSMDFLHKLTNHLGNIYSENGKFEEATEMYRESIRLRDSLFSKERNEIVYEMEAKYESEKKENEINHQRSLLLESELNSLKKQRWINVLIGSIILFGLLVIFYFLRRKRVAETEKEKAILAEKERGLKAVIKSQEKERERIAKNLHDGVIQQLVSLKFGLDNLKAKKVENLVKQLDNATYELRDLSHDLMPKNLEKFGLNEAVSNLLETSLSNTSLSYSYDCHGLQEKLSKEVKINIYRTTQELIHNAVKHSKASHIDVQLYQIDDSIHVIFEDNGVGFNTGSSFEGIGIQSINSRIKSLDGTINYENSPNEGTLITIKISL